MKTSSFSLRVMRRVSDVYLWNMALNVYPPDKLPSIVCVLFGEFFCLLPESIGDCCCSCAVVVVVAVVVVIVVVIRKIKRLFLSFVPKTKSRFRLYF